MNSLAASLQLLTPLLYVFLLTFCRIGAAFAFFPSFSDSVPQQSRLFAALAVSMPISLLAGEGIAVPADQSTMVHAVMMNMTVGVYFGVSTRIMLSAFQTGGQMMGQLSGLYNPFNVAGHSFEGSTVISSILVMAGTALIFAADLHLQFIAALANSFKTVSLHGTLSPEVMNAGVIKVVQTAFSMSVQFAAPFLVLGLVFNLALGIANRMMPAMPVFFVFSPILMFVGIFLIIVVFAAVASMFVDNMSSMILGL